MTAMKKTLRQQLHAEYKAALTHIHGEHLPESLATALKAQWAKLNPLIPSDAEYQTAGVLMDGRDSLSHSQRFAPFDEALASFGQLIREIEAMPRPPPQSPG